MFAVSLLLAATAIVLSDTGEQQAYQNGMIGDDDPVCEHVYDTVWSFDGDNHWYECTVCGEPQELFAHTLVYFDNTDETHDVYCDECDYADDGVACMYNITKYDATDHWKECACGAKDSVTGHSFDWDSDLTDHWKICDDCGYEGVPDPHMFDIPDYDDDYHWSACACGAKDSVTGHSFDWDSDPTDHWKICDDCGYEGLPETHVFDKYDHDEDNHWFVCDDCGAVESAPLAAHVFDKFGKDDDYHWYVCDCGAIKDAPAVEHLFSTQNWDDDYHWDECICGATDGVTGHSFDWGSDSTHHWDKCDNCGYEGDHGVHSYYILDFDSDYHWLICDCGAVEPVLPVEHDFDVPGCDDVNHWFACVCGVVDEGTILAHTFTPWAYYDDDYHDHECTTCGKVVTGLHDLSTCEYYDEDDHVHVCSVCAGGVYEPHNFDILWTTTETDHWHECICGDKSDQGIHVSSEWIELDPAGCVTDGSRHKECTVCEFVIETEVLYATGHSFGLWDSDEDGHWRVCSECDDDESGDHTPGDWVIDSEATDKEEGSRHKECTVCGYTTATEVIPIVMPEPGEVNVIVVAAIVVGMALMIVAAVYICTRP